MPRPTVVIKPSPLTTHLLLSSIEGEMMRAVLPPPGMPHPRAAPTLLEGLSLWVGRPLSVVLVADEPVSSSGLGLCDEWGFGHHTLHYEVEVLQPRRGRRRLGSFGALRQVLQRGVR